MHHTKPQMLRETAKKLNELYPSRHLAAKVQEKQQIT
jgi:hypothetical protein